MEIKFKTYWVGNSSEHLDKEMKKSGWKDGYYCNRFSRGENEVAFIHIRKNNYTGRVMQYIEISSLENGEWRAMESTTPHFIEKDEMIKYLVSEGWKADYPLSLDYLPFQMEEKVRLGHMLQKGDIRRIFSREAIGDWYDMHFVRKEDIDKGVFTVYQNSYASPMGNGQCEIWPVDFKSLDELLTAITTGTTNFETFNLEEDWIKNLKVPVKWFSGRNNDWDRKVIEPRF